MSSYKWFYGLNLISLIFSLSRALLISVVLAEIGGNAYHFGVLAASTAIMNIFGTYVGGKLIDKFNVVKVISASKICISLMLVLLVLLYNHGDISIYLWIFSSGILSFFIAIDVISRPIYVIKKFKDIKIFSSIRKESLLMGIAKLVGFSMAGYINNKFYYFIFLCDFLMSIVLFLWYKRNSIIIESRELKVDEHLFFNDFIKNKSLLFMFINEMMIGFFVIPISNQFLVISKYFHVNFAFFLIMAAIGNITINLFYKKEPFSYFRFFSWVYGFVLILYISMASISDVDFNMFLLGLIGYGFGCIHTISLLVIRGSNHKEVKEYKNYASIMGLFFIGFSIANALGSFIFGSLIHSFNLPKALYIYSLLLCVLSIFMFFYFNKKLNTNNDIVFKEEILKEESKEEDLFH